MCAKNSKNAFNFAKAIHGRMCLDMCRKICIRECRPNKIKGLQSLQLKFFKSRTVPVFNILTKLTTYYLNTHVIIVMTKTARTFLVTAISV